MPMGSLLSFKHTHTLSFLSFFLHLSFSHSLSTHIHTMHTLHTTIFLFFSLSISYTYTYTHTYIYTHTYTHKHTHVHLFHLRGCERAIILTKFPDIIFSSKFDVKHFWLNIIFSSESTKKRKQTIFLFPSIHNLTIKELFLSEV